MTNPLDQHRNRVVNRIMHFVVLSAGCAVDALCKLAKEGEAAGVNLGSTRWVSLVVS